MEDNVEREDIALIEKDKIDRNTNDNEKKQENLEPNASRRYVVIGYICMFFGVTGYAVAIATAQAAGNKTNIFLVNMFRYAVEISLSVMCVVLGKYSLAVAKNDIYKFVIGAVSNLSFLVMFYLSAPLLPVGNMNGIFSGFQIVFAVFVDVVRKQVSRISVSSAVVAIVGLILVTQPWHVQTDPTLSPCDYIDNNYSIILQESLVSNKSNISMIEKTTHHFISPLVKGYILVAISALASCISDNMSRSLMQTYPVFHVFFWISLLQAILTGCILCGVAIFETSTLSLPSGTACLGFTIGFIISMTISHILLNITFAYFPVSEEAMLLSLSIIGLYVIQRTVLKMFHPGNANTVEVIGIISIIIASILSLLISHFCKK